MLSKPCHAACRASIWIAVLCSACGSDGDGAGPPTNPSSDAGTEASPDAPSDVALDQVGEAAPEAGPDAPLGPVELTVFHTSDEHGWLQPLVSSGIVYGGAANFFAQIKGDGFDPATDLLVSSGDNWTGPAITTLFQGKPMVDAFNYMGYAATAIGNHEFDFGVAVLSQRASESNYAYLGANLYDKGTDDRVAFARPYKIVRVQGIDVGLIGLTTPSTATATNPKLVADIDFENITETLESVVPEVRAAGAEVVLVLAHQDAYWMNQVAAELTVPVDGIFTGHDHGSLHEVVHGIPVVGSGWGLQGYSVTRFVYDPATEQTSFLDTRFEPVAYAESGSNPVTPDPGLLDLVDGWQAQLDTELGEEIGYTETGITMGWQEGNWVTDAWLWAFPDADVALQNFGGLRQPISPGVIKLEDVFGVMPFDNAIYELELTGAQLQEDLAIGTESCTMGGCYIAVGGITFSGTGSSVSVTLQGGAPLDLQATYRVLVNDYMYETGPYPLKAQDPTPIDLGVNFREPVVDWTRQLNTSPSDPLEAHIDSTPRNQ